LAFANRAHINENGMLALPCAAQNLARDPELKRRYLGL
jgi:ABC-type branched-subunit amino acid transport system ATPase component